MTATTRRLALAALIAALVFSGGARPVALVANHSTTTARS